jgi:hypothetical protein
MDEIKPAAELEADLAQPSDRLKMKSGVQRNAGGLVRLNRGDDGMMAQGAGAGDQILQQSRTDATPMLPRMDILISLWD